MKILYVLLLLFQSKNKMKLAIFHLISFKFNIYTYRYIYITKFAFGANNRYLKERIKPKFWRQFFNLEKFKVLDSSGQ